MKKLILLACLFMLVIQTKAQDSEPIQIINGKFYKYDIRLNMKTLKDIVKPMPLAYQEVKSGASRRTWGGILFWSGDIIAVTAVAGLIAGNEEMFESSGDALKAIGFGIALAIPGSLLSRSGSKRLVNGIGLYNSSLKSDPSLQGTSLNIGLTNNGIGLTIRF